MSLGLWLIYLFFDVKIVLVSSFKDDGRRDVGVGVSSSPLNPGSVEQPEHEAQEERENSETNAKSDDRRYSCSC